MRHLFVLALLTGVGFLGGCQKEPATPAPPPSKAKPAKPASELLLRWHFIGANQLTGNTNAARLKQIWALPASVKLREQAFQQLAGAVPRLLSLSVQTTNAAGVFHPLLDDLVRSESVFELHEGPGGAAVWALAVALDDQRAALWQTNTSSQSGASLQRSGSWTLFASSENAAPAARMLQDIKQRGRPAPALSNDWLEVEADLPRLARKFSWPALVEWPRARLAVNGKDDYLRSNVRMHFTKPLSLSLDPWLIPTNIIHDPVISFTAVRGLAAWLKEQPWFRGMEIQPTPNQAFLWAQSPVPTQTFFALPAPDAGRQMERSIPALMQRWNTNLAAHQRGELIRGTNQTELIWARVPVPLAGPFLRAAPDAQGGYLLGGLFPPVPSTSPLPRELLQQVGDRTNLLYYDWEVTEPRLMQWHQMFQLSSMLLNKMPDLSMGAGQQWLVAAAPHLGNSVTEVTVNSPQELLLARKSHLGFTGIELALLARWLEGAAMPWQEQKPLLPPGVVKPPPAP